MTRYRFSQINNHPMTAVQGSSRAGGMARCSRQPSRCFILLTMCSVGFRGHGRSPHQDRGCPWRTGLSCTKGSCLPIHRWRGALSPMRSLRPFTSIWETKIQMSVQQTPMENLGSKHLGNLVLYSSGTVQNKTGCTPMLTLSTGARNLENWLNMKKRW